MHAHLPRSGPPTRAFRALLLLFLATLAALAPPAALGAGTGMPTGSGAWSPQELRAAYGLPTTQSGTAYADRTVAILAVGHHLNVDTALATYRSYYKLSACRESTGCLSRIAIDSTGALVTPSTATVGYPSSSAGQELMLDVDMVSAACESCHILLVEAADTRLFDLAATAAYNAGATTISESSSFLETSTTATSSPYPGVPLVASSGDDGWKDYQAPPAGLKGGDAHAPGDQPSVVSVGGTNMVGTPATGFTETVWNVAPPAAGYGATGSGCSKKPKPAWQSTVTFCAGRMDNDVSFVADPNTGVSVYANPPATYVGWSRRGGTSAGAPFIAGLLAMADPTIRALGPRAFYENPGMFRDVTSGTNGPSTTSCSPALICNAGPGYDGPTGLGSPIGIPQPKLKPFVVYGNGAIDAGQPAYYANSVATGWQQRSLGVSPSYASRISDVTQPVAVVKDGVPTVFFTNARDGNKLAAATWTPKGGWNVATISTSGAVAGSRMSAFIDENGQPAVAFTDGYNIDSSFRYNCLTIVRRSGSSWTTDQLGSAYPVYTGSGPSVATTAANPGGVIAYFDANRGGKLSVLTKNASGAWQKTDLTTDTPTTYSSPAAVHTYEGMLPAPSTSYGAVDGYAIFYASQDLGGQVVRTSYGNTATGWIRENLNGDPIALFSNIAAYSNPTSDPRGRVFFADAWQGRKISSWTYAGGWQQNLLGTAAAATNTGPSVAMDGTSASVFFHDAAGDALSVYQQSLPTGARPSGAVPGWTLTTLPTTLSTDTSPGAAAAYALP